MSARATAADAGCWVAGRHGHYAMPGVIEIALAYGWADEQASGIAQRYPDLSESDQDALSDTVDDAEQWLNSHVAPQGFSFGWHDGEFFLWSDSEWEGDW